MRFFVAVIGLLAMTAANASASTTRMFPARATGTTLTVESYSRGNCALITVRNRRGHRLLRLDDNCHGWNQATCGGIRFLKSNGVIASQAFAFYSRGHGILDLPVLVSAAIRERAGNSEYLHLRFDRPICTRAGFRIPFGGSQVRVGSSGSAHSLDGTIWISPGGVHLTRLSAL